MIKTKSILDQLIDVYYNEEWWHKNKMPYEEAMRYYKKMLREGNILYYEEYGELLGYVEYWMLNYEQLGRVKANAPFSSFVENVKDGDILYVANLWVRADLRQTHVFKILKLMLFKNVHNKNYKYIVGDDTTKAFRRKHG